jgi:hypothetical protein
MDLDCSFLGAELRDVNPPRKPGTLACHEKIRTGSFNHTSL